MSFWSRIVDSISGDDRTHTPDTYGDPSRFAYIDIEVGVNDKRVHDIGALRWDGAVFHANDKKALADFLRDVDFLCGHNIIHHDIP